MTKRLFLLRHAKALQDPTLIDAQRPLAERGRQDAAQCATWFSRNALQVDVVLTSTAERTRQTHEIMAEALRSARHSAYVPELYLALAQDMLEQIQQQTEDTQSLMLIGHNPGLHELAYMLTENPLLEQGFPTCALAIIDFQQPSWQRIAHAGGVLSGLWTPKAGEVAGAVSR